MIITALVLLAIWNLYLTFIKAKNEDLRILDLRVKDLLDQNLKKNNARKLAEYAELKGYYQWDVERSFCYFYKSVEVKHFEQTFQHKQMEESFPIEQLERKITEVKELIKRNCPEKCEDRK